MDKRFRLNRVFLLVMAVIIVVANAWWLSMDQRPFAWDESIHYMGAVGYARSLSQGLGAWKSILYQSDFYPPLAELAAAFFFKIAGVSPHAASFFNVFYLIGIVILLAALGWELFDAETGLLAGCLFSASSMIVLQSKFFMLDIPLVFWFCLGFYTYVRSDHFSRRGWALLYGAVLGLALLCKWSALFFLGLSPVLMAWLALRQNPGAWKKAGQHLVLAYLIAGVLAAPWYLVHLVKLFKNTHSYIYQRGVVIGSPPLLSPFSWFYYLLGLVKQMGWPLGLVVLAGLVLFFARQKKHRLLLLVWTGVPYLILTLIRNKDCRYTLPLVALFCLMSMAWMQTISVAWRRRLAVIVVGFTGLQFVYAHTGAPDSRIYPQLNREILGAKIVESLAPDHRPWPLGDILKEVEARSDSKHPILRVIPDDAHFSQVAFTVEQSRHPGRVRLASVSDWPAFTDFAVTKTGSLGLPFALADRLPIHEALGNTATADGRRFTLVKTFPLPDGSMAQLYQRLEILDPRPGWEIIHDLRQELNRLLSSYIKDPRVLEIDFDSRSDRETRSGHFQTIRIQASDGLLGDFKHKPLGLPFSEVDLEIHNVRLDLVRAREGRIVPFQLDELRVNRLEIHDDDLNQALAASADNLKQLRVVFQKGGIQADWLSRVPARVSVALSITPDRSMEDSENLSFRLIGLGLPRIQAPGSLVQPLVEDFNPLLKSSGFPGKVQLGRLVLAGNKLLLGEDITNE